MQKGFKNVTISGKLFLTPLVGIIFLTMLAIAAYLGLASQKTAIVDMYNKRFKGYQYSSTIIKEMTTVHANIYGVLSWTSANYDSKRIDSLAKEQIATLDKNISFVQDLLKSGALNETEAALYRTSLEKLGNYKKAALGVIDLASADIGMANTYMSLAVTRFQDLSQSLQKLLELEDRLSQESYDQSLRRFTVTLSVFAALFVLAMFLSIFFGVYLLRKMIILPLLAIADAAQKISEGDLTFDVEAKGGDEIGRIALLLKDSFRSLGGILLGIKELSSKISKVIEDVERESKSIVKSAEVETDAIANISSSIEELSATASEISGNTENLAVSTEQTSAAIDELVWSIKNINDTTQDLSIEIESTSSSIQELVSSIKEVASNADILEKATEDTLSAISEITASIKQVETTAKESSIQTQKVTSEAATIGMTSIDKTIAGMKNIQTAVEQTSEFIKALGKRSEDIGKILNVIKDVTEQTHLLHLNASILAAEAGHAGQGFAVVADQIKALAQRTALSTKEIATLIQTVQKDVKNVDEAMQKGIQFVTEGFALTAEAGNALRKILESSKSSSGMALTIEHSATEQAKAARFVVGSMERVRDMTGQIAKATAEQSKNAAQISQATEKMRSASRQVSRTTEEQTSTSKQISGSIENVSARSMQISTALADHKRGSQNILKSVEEVKNIPQANRELADRISKTLGELQGDSELLKTKMDRFKLSARETAGASVEHLDVDE